jgi:hypothetical protein
MVEVEVEQEEVVEVVETHMQVDVKMEKNWMTKR